MKLIIAGGRMFTETNLIVAYINMLYKTEMIKEPTHIISGMANGADACGVSIANASNIELIEMPANWEGHGKRAGYLRNAEMALIGDVLIAAWDGNSRGTLNMIDEMLFLNKPVFILPYQEG